MVKNPFAKPAAQKAVDCPSRSGCAGAGKEGEGCASCASRPQASEGPSGQDREIARNLANIRHVLFVMSGKGGVGKSSVSVNIAAALASKGFKTGILDVDIHGPSVPRLLGLTQGLEMDEAGKKLIPAVYNEHLRVLSMDSLLRDKNTAVLWRGPKKTAAIRQFISDVAWDDLDFLVIDSPPGTGDEHMTILRTIPQALCVVVTTPQEISLADVRKALNFLQHAHGRVLGIVENMSGLACPQCGYNIPLFKQGGGALLAESYGVPFLGAVPLDPATVVAADTGVPVVLLDGEHPAKTQFTAVAANIAEGCASGRWVEMSLPASSNPN